jgi:DNA-directed RNA polymerase subunit RPC12/RpoP
MDKSKVRIWTAYQWTCDDCGKDNFERAVTVELTPNDRQELAEDNDCDPDEIRNVELCSYPEEVTCQHCGSEFETENPED